MGKNSAAERRWGNVSLTAGGLALLLVFSSANGFAIKWQFRIHQEITMAGLNPDPAQIPEAPAFEIVLDHGAKVGFAIPVIQYITLYNVWTDDLQGLQHSDKHFDSDDLGRGSRRLIQLRELIIDTLVDASFGKPTDATALAESEVRVRLARSDLGQALHTLQDFYAHTNWVEITELSMDNVYGSLGHEVENPPSLQETCNEANPAASGVLSSGWFVDLQNLCTAPDGKCAHGDGQICGINKDSYPQAGERYTAARAQAIEATHLFVQDTLEQVLTASPRLHGAFGESAARDAVQLAVCRFMGVPEPAETCLKSEFVDWTSIDHSNRIASGSLGLTSVTFTWSEEGSVPATWFGGDLDWFSSNAFTPSLLATDGLEFVSLKSPAPAPTYTITFDEPLSNPVLHIGSNASILTFLAANPLEVSGDERFDVVGNQVIGSDHNQPNGIDANGTVVFSGTVTSLTFTAAYPGPAELGEGIRLQIGLSP